MLFIVSIAFPLFLISVVTLLQTHSNPEYLGRVMAVFAMALQGGAIGWILGGVLMDTVGNFETVLITVAGGTIVVLITMVVSKEFRNA